MINMNDIQLLNTSESFASDFCCHAEYKIIFLLVRRISASFQYNCAKNGKGLKIGTKEADTT